MPKLEIWQWILGALCALTLGLSKTCMPGAGTLTAPLMVLTVGDARLSPAWTAPILIVGDVFAVTYWRRHTEARALLSLIPWVAAGMAGGAFALALDEHVLRLIVGAIVVSMLVVNVVRRLRPDLGVSGRPWIYGVVGGFATTVATSAGPVM